MIIPQTGLDYIQMGMPTYAKEAANPPSVGVVNLEQGAGVSAVEMGVAAQLGKALEEIIRQLDLKIPVTVRLFKGDLTSPRVYQSGPRAGQEYEARNTSALGVASIWQRPGAPPVKARINISVSKHQTAEAIWTTMTHELGHIIERTTYAAAPENVRSAVDAAYDKFLKAMGPTATLGDLVRQRMNAIDIAAGVFDPNDTRLISEISPRDQAYQQSKTEWFAEQVTKEVGVVT